MNHMLIKFLSGLGLIGLLLSGCSTPPQTQTTFPSTGRTPSPSKNPSPTLEPGMSPYPTRTPLPTDLSAIAAEYHCYTDSYESPSKTWVLFNECRNPPPGPGGAALLYNTKTNQFRVYPYCAYMHACEEFLGAFMAHLSPIAWSADDESLYAEFYWGGDSCAWFPNFSQLLIFDLTTGVSSIYHERAALNKLSPDLSQVAMVEFGSQNLPVVIVRNLRDDTQFSFTLAPQFLEAGDLAWSQDGALLAFIAVDEDAICSDPSSFSVMVIEVATRHRFTIIKEYKHPLHIATWRDGYVLELIDDTNQEIIQYSFPDRQMFITPEP